jgi:hypothetical protein
LVPDWPDVMLSATESGWIDSVVFKQWLERAVVLWQPRRQLREGVLEPLVLVVDGHVSHVSLEALTVAERAGVHMLLLPAHTSHTTQPLDVACFKAWHTNFGTALHEFRVRNPRTPVDRTIFLRLARLPWQKALSEANITSGFATTGIWPFSREAILRSTTKSSLSPAHTVDLRPRIDPTKTVSSASPGPAIAAALHESACLASASSALTPILPQQYLRMPKRDLASRVLQCEAEIEVLKSKRVDDILRLPLAPIDPNLPAKSRKRSKTVQGGRVITAQELRDQLAAEETEKQRLLQQKTDAKRRKAEERARKTLQKSTSASRRLVAAVQPSLAVTSPAPQVPSTGLAVHMPETRTDNAL